ncbi:MAG: right-handed parallel beta-helix repeat-containing protein, partial [Candidatus Zixiibacteriota bacterium]
DSTSIIQGFTIQNGIGVILDERAGGGIYCYSSSPTIRANVVIKNKCWSGGGIFCYEASPIINNNHIKENRGTFGGGILCGGSSPIISQNVIIGNSSSQGGGICCYTSSPSIRNNTINRNSSDALYGGGITCIYQSSPYITNNIISNSLNGGIYCYGGSFPVISYNDVWNNADGNFVDCPAGVGDTSWGPNINGIPCDSFYNIIRNPLFVDSLNDFHLLEGSPCIDAGDNSAAGDSDLDGNPRIVDGNDDDSAVVDMGAYEY